MFADTQAYSEVITVKIASGQHPAHQKKRYTLRIQCAKSNKQP